MKRTIIIAICMGLFVFGCKKGKQDVKSGDDGKSKPTASDTGDANARKAPTPGEVKVATGDLRDLLLALKRVHFALDANTLTEGGRNALDEAAEKLKALPKVALYVDGHTDERGTTEYNMGLGERRAQTVVDYLTRLGIKGERLNTVTFGEELPLGSGSGELQLAKNRRVDFRIMRGDIQFVLEEGEPVDDEGKPIQDISKTN